MVAGGGAGGTAVTPLEPAAPRDVVLEECCCPVWAHSTRRALQEHPNITSTAVTLRLHCFVPAWLRQAASVKHREMDGAWQGCSSHLCLSPVMQVETSRLVAVAKVPFAGGAGLQSPHGDSSLGILQVLVFSPGLTPACDADRRESRALGHLQPDWH